MYFLKLIFGIVFIQITTIVSLFFMLPIPFALTENASLLYLALPLLLASFSIALWFHTLSHHLTEKAVAQVKTDFSKEKEQLHIKTEKKIAKETKRTHAKANFKVGAAFAGVIGIGILFIFTQMLTVGILTLTAAGSALGGYYWRGKRIDKERKNVQIPTIEVKAIE